MTNQNKDMDGNGDGNKELNRLREKYRILLKQRKYAEAERMENEEGLDFRILNWVISDIIMKRNGQSRELIETFAHRGYGQEWLDEYGIECEKKPIKSGEAKG